MSVDCTFYKHQDFGGDSRSYSLSNSWRYRWIKFGSPLKNEITSLRANAYSGRNAHVYGFTGNNFLGDYASLNIPNGWTSWWSNVGGQMNDDIESALMINRSNDEFTLSMEDTIADEFSTQLASFLAGEDASARGAPKVYATFYPSWDPNRKFVTIEQGLRVDVPWWPDYDASMRYDIYFYLHSPTEVRAYVAWVHTWVEGGVFSGKINDQLHPQVMSGASDVNDALAGQLPLLSLVALFRGPIQSLYLLPGREPLMPPPNSSFGATGNAKEDCQLVLTF
jgi:hypothetical protein